MARIIDRLIYRVGEVSFAVGDVFRRFGQRCYYKAASRRIARASK